MMHLDTAATIALYIVLVFVLLFAVLTVAILGGIAFALKALEAKLSELVGKLDPVLTKTTEALDTVQRVTSNVGDRADQILLRGENLTDDLAKKVESTSNVVQKAVATPLINISSLAAGVAETLSSLNRSWNKTKQNHTNSNRSGSNGHQ